MARQIYYRLEFSDEAGTSSIRRRWQLDFIADDAVVTVPDFTGTPLPLIGGDYPITVEHIRRDGPYDPILGSSANIELWVTDDTSYRDFNSDGRFVWETRLRYLDADDNATLYWCGYILPEDGNESVTTRPFGVSFTSIDGLGILGSQLYPIGSSRPITSEANVSLISLISDCLEQTGLDLDLYVDSGIETTSGDALINVTTTQYAFVDENVQDRSNLKEILEGILNTFNCRVFQADGRWYVVNNSTYGINNDSVTFKVFNHLGVAQADQTLNVRQTIGGTGSTAQIRDNDLVFTPRPPVGSVQANVLPATAINYVNNGNFENLTPLGWTENGPDSIQFSTTALNGRSVTTNRSVDDTTSFWLRNTVPVVVDYNFPISISFDYFLERITGGNAAFSSDITVYPYVVLPTPIQGAKLVSNSLGFLAPLFGQSPIERETFQTNLLQWHQKDGRWAAIEGTDISTHEFYRNTIELDTIQGWSDGSIEIGKLADRVSIFSGASQIPEGGTLFLQFTYPRALDGDNDGFNSTNSLRMHIDNITARNVFTNDEVNPIFERVQPNEIDTLEYEPLFFSYEDSTDGIYQKLTVSDYYEKQDGTSGTARSIEEIVTQQKLNDYRDQFKYYEGTLIGTGTKPLSQADKILINYAGYTETNSAICNGGVFNPKRNSYDLAMYVPDQDTDVTSDFFTENVDLIAAPAPDRAAALSFIQVTIAPEDNVGVDISEEVLMLPKRYFRIEEPSGSTVERTIRLNNPTGYVGTSATITSTLPSWIIPRGEFQNVNGYLELGVEITVPDTPEFVNIEVDGVYTLFTPEATPGVVATSVVVTNSGTNLAGNATTTYVTSGVPGTVSHFTHHIRPDANFQLFAGNFDATYTDTSLSNFDAVSGVDSVAIDFAYTVPTTPETVAVTVTGNATPAGTLGVDLFTRTVNFGTAPANTRFHEASNTFTGVPGATQDYFITLIPDADYQITSVVAPTLPAGIIANGVPYPAGENWEIPIQVTIGSANDTVNITQGAIAVSQEPYSLTFNVNNIGVENASFSPASHRITFDESDFGDSITPFVITITPQEGRAFANVTDVAIDINEAAVRTPNGVVVLAEDDFTAALQVSDGNILVTVAGVFPSVGDQYVLDINALGFEDGTAQPAFMPATQGDITGEIFRMVNNQSHTLKIPVVANGSWNVETDESWITLAVRDNDLTVGTVNIGIASNASGVRSGTVRLTDGQTPATVIDTVQISQLEVTEPLASSISLAAVTSDAVAYDDSTTSFTFTVTANGRWQIYGGTGTDAVGAGTLLSSPPTGGIGTTSVTITSSGFAGTLWQGNNIIVQPEGGGGSLASITYYVYKSVVTQSEYDSIVASAPASVRNSTFYIL